MRTRSPINFRAFLVSALIVVGAVFCAYLYAAVSKTVGITVAAIYLSVVVAFLIVSVIKFKRKSCKLRVLICAAFSLIVSVMAFGFGAGNARSREVSDGYGGYHEVEGRICAFDLRSGIYKADLEALRFDGKEIKGVLRVTFSASDNNNAENMDVGDRISFGAFITAVGLADDGAINGSSYRTDIRFYATVDPANVKISFGKPSLIEKFTQSLNRLLVDNMGDKYGNIAFSMFTGDKHALDYSISDAFSAAGIGHVLAVSGLHIGFMVLLIDLLLRKVSKRKRFPILTIIICLYVVLADFSPSVVRAAIMTVVSGLSVFVGGRRDLLSSLSFSFCLILAVRPFYLFEAGFLLSFGALFGIAMFADRMAKFLARHGFGRKAGEAIGSAVSVQIGVTPTLIYFFNKIQVLAILVNIVLIPYVAAVFMIMVVCMIIGAIPTFGAVLLVPKYMLVPIDYIAQGISAVPFANITVYATAAVFLSYPVMFFAGGLYMMPKGKIAVVLASVFACAAFCAPLPMSDGLLTVVDSASVDTVITDDGKTYLIGYVRDKYAVTEALKHNRCKRLDAVYLLGCDQNTVNAIIELNDDFQVGVVYNDTFGDTGARLIDNGINFKLYSDTEDHPVCEVKLSGERVGYEYRGVLFAEDNADPIIFSSYNVVRVKTYDNAQDGVAYLCNYVKDERENVKTLSNGMYTYDLGRR